MPISKCRGVCSKPMASYFYQNSKEHHWFRMDKPRFSSQHFFGGFGECLFERAYAFENRRSDKLHVLVSQIWRMSLLTLRIVL